VLALASEALTMLINSGLSDAPPTRKPSMSVLPARKPSMSALPASSVERRGREGKMYQ